MARQRREKNAFGRYYVQQASRSGRVIFRSDADRLCFLDILRDAHRQFCFAVEAFCLQEEGEYHLLLRLSGSDISNLMKSINIAYVLASKQQAGLFRDRFASRLLHTESECQALLEQIKRRAAHKGQWNSFCQNMTGRLREDGYLSFPSLAYKEGRETDEATALLSKQELIEELERVAASEGLALSDLLQNKVKRDELIVQARRSTLLPLKDLGEVFGGLSESSICKIMRRSKHE